MTKRIKSYLEGYFLAGNVNETDRMTAKEMVSQLHILADEGEIQVEDIPEITTVANWITRYAANLKKSLAYEEVSSDNNQCEYIDESRKGKKPIFDNSNNDVGRLTKRQKS